jgi:adenosylhomocysteine nucleosidase
MIAALFAAFPQELRHIRKYGPSAQSPEACHFPSRGKPDPACDIITVQTGIGAANMEIAFRRVFQELRPNIVLSVGFGGALYEDAEIGDIVWSSRALLIRGDRTPEHEHPAEDTVPGSDLGRQIGEKLRERTAAREGSIVTLPEMMTKSKIKKMIPSDLPFPVCDMETFYLARLSHQNRVPFLAVRSITDRLDEDVPQEFLAVTDGTGHYRLSRALGLLLAKPKLIPASVRLGRNAARASKNLGKALDSLVEILSAFVPREAMS